MSTLRWRTEPMVLRIAKAISRYIGFGDEDVPIHAQRPVAEKRGPDPARSLTELRLMPSPERKTQHSDHKWRRHPQLRAYEAPISEDVREGRRKAVRGLYAARAGAIDVATEHFTLAAQCADVDLTAVPGFWNLTRGQMQAAVDAYEAVGRYRDAAALDAHISTIFRPSLVGASQQPIVPRRPQRKVVST